MRRYHLVLAAAGLAAALSTGCGAASSAGLVAGTESPSPTVTDSPSPTPTKTPGREGCTPGYWKNHPGAWAFPTTTTLGSVFTFPAELSSFESRTALEALSSKGGPGLPGATGILMRAAVAALLNAASDGVAYPLEAGDVIEKVNTALATLDRAAILDAAAELDRLNNLGCPL